jgi:MFS family permease
VSVRRLWSELRNGPLGHRQFRLLFLGRTTSFVGNAFANVALAFAVLELTGSKADLGYVLAARSLPLVIFLLVGGIWADRLPRPTRSARSFSSRSASLSPVRPPRSSAHGRRSWALPRSA